MVLITIALWKETNEINVLSFQLTRKHNRCVIISSAAAVVFLFLAGLWFTEANINGPNFHPKLTLAAPTIGYSVSCCVSCCLAQQDSVDG